MKDSRSKDQEYKRIVINIVKNRFRITRELNLREAWDIAHTAETGQLLILMNEIHFKTLHLTGSESQNRKLNWDKFTPPSSFQFSGEDK